MSDRFINRELSWLNFNKRILGEANDTDIPLMERLKFLSITSSNLDEFFMVRVASLKDQINAGYKGRDISGMTATEQIDAILDVTHHFVDEQYHTFNEGFIKALRDNNLRIIYHHEDLDDAQAAYVDRYFQTDVFPVLTPMAVDSSRPFPLIRNRSLNIGALIRDRQDKDRIDFATVQVPSGLSRVVTIPDDIDGHTCVILLEQIIEKNIGKLFLNYKVLNATPYRVMRNADLPFDEDDASDLLLEIEKQLKRRQWGEPIRLEVEKGIDKHLLKTLKKELPISDPSIYMIDGPLDLTFLMSVYGIDGYDDLKDKPFTPCQPKYIDPDTCLFDQIKERDILLHHPYESFDPVVSFIRQASTDPDVLAIKQTLYRVSSNSPIIASLAKAAENGKQVSVLVELKARFDEENNILWARKLEEAGCHVIYGLVGLKTHSKITLVVRKEEDGIRRYVHLGTGNYNDSTAKLYTDMGLFTSKRAYGEDATAVFNMLSGYSQPLTWHKLSLAPQWLRGKFLSLIAKEQANAIKKRPAHIIAKMNSLCDKEIIEALYAASKDGVRIDLIVRGICCLRTDLEGISDNIHVRSIVGNFLEHSRIFYFENNGEPEIYMSSADWMPRNLDKRVEILFPIEDPVLKKDIRHILDIQLSDTKKAHMMQPDGTYKKLTDSSHKKISAQEVFMKEANYSTSNNK